MVRQRGISLAELSVCCLIFMILLVAVMFTYVQSARTFQLLITRQGVETELRRINALLRRDVTLTDFRSLGCLDRVSSDSNDERDCLSFVSLDAWTDRSNFDEFLKPRWNVYVTYYGTSLPGEMVPPVGERGLGQLIRKEIAETVRFPVPLLSSRLATFLVSPGSNYKLLTRNLVAFEVEEDQVDENIRVHLILRSSEEATTAGRKREREILECYIDMRPENTWPPR